MKRVFKLVDLASEWTGKGVSWLIPVLVLVMVLEVVLRYVFNAPTVWNYETVMMMGTTIALLSYAYVHRHHGHIRVDVFYTMMSQRKRAIVDIIGALIFFFPLLFFLSRTSIEWTVDSIKSGEVFREGSWYPPTSPLRVIVALGYIMLLCQGVVNFCRDMYFLTKGKSYEQ